MSNGDSMEKYKLKQINEDIKNLLGTKYDDLFEDVIKSRGVRYSLLNHINSINVKNDIVNAKVKGNDIYNVKIEFEKEKIKKVSCTCLYHEKSVYCKHIYAVLYELNKEKRLEACNRFKECILYNAKQFNDFFNEVNDIVKYNKKKLNKEFINKYEDIYYDFSNKYSNLKLDKKELSKLNNYFIMINNDYEKLDNVYNELLKIKDINLDIKDIRKILKRTSLVEERIYLDDISIEELIEIKQEIPNLNLDKSDIEYVEDKIKDFIEELDDIEKINEIKYKLKKINVDTSICDRTIRRLNGIKVNDVKDLDKEDIEYFIYNCDDVFVLVNIKKYMSKYKFDEEYYNDIEDYINSGIDSIYKIEELKELKKIMKEYNFDLSYINEAIYNLKNNVYKESNDPLIRKLDAYIESTPMEVLEKVSEYNIKNDEDNRIIQKAIKNKKKKIKELNNQKRKNVISNTLGAFSILDAILSLFSSSTKRNNSNYSDVENDEILKGNYEPYQFEEEDLEEDDYYYDDLD